MNLFTAFAQRSSALMGSGPVFLGAVLLVTVWALTGPYFNFSESWQLIINTGTTIITFLMVFLIQNTQNRDARTMHLKLDELIRSIKTARNDMIHLDELTDEQLDHLEAEFKKLRNAVHTMEREVNDARKSVSEQKAAV